ncbi:hypothetical protein DICPUDRAFT_158710 [Dictyostelium purpureum]|uniref:Uncharacterized protein n=1 Tax=Dictyostelium purpureum TaxID=5786 RepID=F1A299_DICPU|nr:uncharacterized protein DICPUDRAFT_158710 [Dictyostelium purpureum]EGC29689.1 hypothetical protein DICPUDRAFT_158710 [Dictyostelium purpureum]|eukprot:XP_003293794.1 hypothetical protein DICPUDRAFT_158710 [Dictyostelium purpureum]
MNCNNKRKNGDTTNNNTDNTNSNNNNDNSISNIKVLMVQNLIIQIHQQIHPVWFLHQMKKTIAPMKLDFGRDKSKAEKFYAKRIESLNLSNEPLTVIKSDECIEFQMSLVKSLHTISCKTKVEQAIFSSNNLELIYLMFKLYKDDLYGNFFRYLKFITKTEILDYIFDNHQELMFSDNNPLWICTNSKAMGHFENLMKSISRKFLIKSNLTITDFENTPSKDFFEGLERAVDNPTVYIFENNKNYPQNSINRYNSYFIKLTNLTQDSAISLFSFLNDSSFNQNFDEPTSGLDSVTALSIMKTLLDLAFYIHAVKHWSS